MPASFDHLASNQLGLITTKQLNDLGWSRGQIEAAVSAGRLFTVRRGVLRGPGARVTREVKILAPILMAGPRGTAVASHGSAAEVIGYRYLARPDLAELSAARRLRLDGVVAHRTGLLGPEHVVVDAPIPHTTPARTVCDLAATTHPRALGQMLDDARRRRLVTLSAVEQTLAALKRADPHRPGLRVIEALLADRAGQTSGGGSGAELDVWVILKQAGVELPVQQHEVIVEGERFFLDYAYPALKIAIEYDPFETHARTKAMWLRHARRRRLLEAAGWLYVTILEDMTAAEVVAAVIEAIGTRMCH